MNKKKFLLGVILLLAGQLSAQAMQLIAVTSDSEITYVLSDVNEIVFENNTMTINSLSDAPLTGVTDISFVDLATEFKTLHPEASVFVFPNPVQTNLSVSGVNGDVKIKLFNLGGTLLQTIPAQEKSTSIDVSSLQPGLYLLQIGERTLKFIKQ